jgi:hypothetical protein
MKRQITWQAGLFRIYIVLGIVGIILLLPCPYFLHRAQANEKNYEEGKKQLREIYSIREKLIQKGAPLENDRWGQTYSIRRHTEDLFAAKEWSERRKNTAEWLDGVPAAAGARSELSSVISLVREYENKILGLESITNDPLWDRSCADDRAMLDGFLSVAIILIAFPWLLHFFIKLAAIPFVKFVFIPFGKWIYLGFRQTNSSTQPSEKGHRSSSPKVSGDQPLSITSVCNIKGQQTGPAIEQWYYAKGNERIGPIPKTELIILIRQGVIGPETLAWSEGMDDWAPISTTRLTCAPKMKKEYDEIRRALPKNREKPPMNKTARVFYKLGAAFFMLPQILGSISLACRNGGATYEQHRQLTNITVPLLLIFGLFAIIDTFKKISERHTKLFILYGLVYVVGLIFIIKNMLNAL